MDNITNQLSTMGKFYEHLNESHKAFINEQHMFFVATAPMSVNGRINVSPKGLDSFSILSDQEVGYMDVISSGNETSAHTLENGRITIMFCSFDKKPKILRLYGEGRAILPDHDKWKEYAAHFNILESTRQLIIARIDLIQTSCGFGVPMYEFLGQRDIHHDWAAQKGKSGLKEYLVKNNLRSLDDLTTDWEQSLASQSSS